MQPRLLEEGVAVHRPQRHLVCLALPRDGERDLDSRRSGGPQPLPQVRQLLDLLAVEAEHDVALGELGERDLLAPQVIALVDVAGDRVGARRFGVDPGCSRGRDSEQRLSAEG